jgi:hypothetical protein
MVVMARFRWDISAQTWEWLRGDYTTINMADLPGTYRVPVCCSSLLLLLHGLLIQYHVHVNL